MTTTPFTFKSAKRIQGFEKKRVQDIFSPLALETNSINLGQAFPNWNPPEFFLEAMSKYVQESSHQYTRSYGHQKLIEAIAKFYSPLLNRKIDPVKNILVSNGGIACLCNIFLGIIDQGDEVILIDPSFDCYRAQITMAGGKVVSIPLFPKSKITKKDLINRGIENLKYSNQDEWDLNWDDLEAAFTKKTKAILINSPHNPTGKVFSEEELKKIANLVKKHEKCVVIFDMVYEAHAYDNYKPLEIPRMCTLPGMWERTISVGSAGKLFSATGVRIGWAVGSEQLIKCAAAFHQYSGFCLYGPLQEAIAETLNKSQEGEYFQEFNNKLKQGRSKLVKELVNSPLNISIYVPEGGCSVLVDIENVDVPQEFYQDPQGELYTKDWAFCMWLCKAKGVVALPCSAFYPEEHSHIGQNFVRIAFCKTQELLEEAGKRIKQTKIQFQKHPEIKETEIQLPQKTRAI